MIQYPPLVKVSYVPYLLLGDDEYWWMNTKLIMEAAQEEIN